LICIFRLEKPGEISRFPTRRNTPVIPVITLFQACNLVLTALWENIGKCGRLSQLRWLLGAL